MMNRSEIEDRRSKIESLRVIRRSFFVLRQDRFYEERIDELRTTLFKLQLPTFNLQRSKGYRG